MKIKALTKFILFICLTGFVNTIVFSQSESQAVAGLKAKYPQYDSYKYNSKQLKYSGLRAYNRYSIDCRYNPKYPCNPGAIVKEGNWIEYWSDGSYKNHGVWLGQVVENMPDPNFEVLNTVLTKGEFDPLDALTPATLWSLLEIHSYELVKSGEITWRNENEVRVSGNVTLTMFKSDLETRKKTVPALFSFTRPDCKAAFVLKSADFSLGGNGSSEVIIETKTHSKEEMKELRLNSVGRKRAEEKAKKEWDALVKVDIPKFDHFHELVFFARGLFMTGSEDEVKSFLYNTLPKFSFIEGSEYMISSRAQESIDLTLKQIFEGSNNYRSQYCDEMQHKEHRTNWYSFYNADQSFSTKLEGELEEGNWKLEQASIYLSEDPITAECPAPVELEVVKDEEFGFSIKMPKGYKRQVSGSAVIYSVTANEVTYTCIANNFGDAESNEARYEQAKSNWKQHSMSGISTYDEVMNDWKVNNVTGRDVKFMGGFRGQSGGLRFDEWYRSIYVGDINFEFYVRGMDYSDANGEFMESFNTMLSGSAGVTTTAPTTKDSYAVGDNVLINIGTWEHGVIDEVLSNGKYNVIVSGKNLSYTAANDALQVDPNPIQSTTTSSSESSTTDFKVGDQVLIRISESGWTPGEVTDIKPDGKYQVHHTESDKNTIQPKQNLKPNPNPPKKEKSGAIKNGVGKFIKN